MPGAAGSALGLWSRTLSRARVDPKPVRGADDRGQGMPGRAKLCDCRAPMPGWHSGSSRKVPGLMEMQTAAGMPRPTEPREGTDMAAPHAMQEVHVTNVISSASYFTSKPRI